jgi:hypothetical protein
VRAAVISVIQTLSDEKLLGPWFSGPSWSMWRSVLKATYALKMTPAEREQFRSIAERDPPKKQVRELWCIAGRRSGKDSIAAAIATHAAISADDITHLLRPGELAAILCLACDRDQSALVLRYIKGHFARSALLRELVVRETQTGLELSNGVEVIVATNSYRAVRGRSVLCCVFDEVSFYRDEFFATSDKQLYAAVEPSLATIPGSMIIGISTPHKRAGLLFEKWRDHFGQEDDDILVVKGPSLVFNPTLNPQLIERALARDPQEASAEWLAEWRSDISGFLDPLWVDRAATLEAGELAPRHGVDYRCFIDPSGGRHDAMTCAIAHKEESRVIVDLVRGRKAPFDPSSVVSEFAHVMQRYGIAEATADRYAAEWVTTSFAEPGRDITITPSERSKSEIYLEVEPMFAQGSIAIPADRTLLHELRCLERRTHRGARDSVDHPLGGRDDWANAMAGAVVAAREMDDLEVWIRCGRD